MLEKTSPLTTFTNARKKEIVARMNNHLGQQKKMLARNAIASVAQGKLRL